MDKSANITNSLLALPGTLSPKQKQPPRSATPGEQGSRQRTWESSLALTTSRFSTSNQREIPGRLCTKYSDVLSTQRLCGTQDRVSPHVAAPHRGRPVRQVPPVPRLFSGRHAALAAGDPFARGSPGATLRTP